MLMLPKSLGIASASTSMRLAPFVEDMAALYRWADLAICRAGALTVSEVAVTRTPSTGATPQAIDNHQMKNAEALMSAGGASIVPQSEWKMMLFQNFSGGF